MAAQNSMLAQVRKRGRGRGVRILSGTSTAKTMFGSGHLCHHFRTLWCSAANHGSIMKLDFRIWSLRYSSSLLCQRHVHRSLLRKDQKDRISCDPVLWTPVFIKITNSRFCQNTLSLLCGNWVLLARVFVTAPKPLLYGYLSLRGPNSAKTSYPNRA